MNELLCQELRRVAHFLKDGNHSGAENLMRHLQLSDDPSTVQDTICILEAYVTQLDETYVHFASFRLLKFYIIRHTEIWCNEKDKLFGFVFRYVESKGDSFISPAWRPVLSEAAMLAAVMVKLGCANGEALDNQRFSDSLRDLISLLHDRASELKVVFVRNFVMQTISEFGLYNSDSRGRRKTMRFHRSCRFAFESEGLAPLLNSLLVCSFGSPMETPRSVAELLSCLSSLLSWHLHTFFEDEDACVDGNDSGGIQTCCFRVSGDWWRSLLTRGIISPTGHTVAIEVLLWNWYCEGNISGVHVERRTIVEFIQYFSGFMMNVWDVSEQLSYCKRFLTLLFHVVQDLLKRAAERHLQQQQQQHQQQEEENVCSTICLALAGISRIVENFGDIFAMDEVDVTCVLELSAFCKMLIELDRLHPDDENIMAALNETLSYLFKLTLNNTRNGKKIHETIASSIAEVLHCFLLVKMSFAHSLDVAEHFEETFTASHIQLVGYIARLNPEKASELLYAALEMLLAKYTDMNEKGEGERIQLQESIWVLFGVINAFLADDIKNETASIPPCFSSISWTERHPVLRVMSILPHFLSHVGNHLSDASPAVVTVLLEVMGTFIAVYSIPHRLGAPSLPLSSDTSLLLCVNFALQSMQTFPFEENVLRASCRILDIIAREKSLHSPLQSSEVMRIVENMVTGGFRFFGTTRGELAGFWIRCESEELVRNCFASVLTSFDLNSSIVASVDVDFCLEQVASFAGLCVSLQDSNLLSLFFDDTATLCGHIIEVVEKRLDEKEMTIQCTEMMMQFFLSCSLQLSDAQMVYFMEGICRTLNLNVKSLSNDSIWIFDDREDNKVRLMRLIFKFLCELARWKMMECDLPSHVVQPLASCSISTLVILLSSLDEHYLVFPELTESAFDAFQLCAEAFVAEFASSTRSDVLLSTLLFALNSESVTTQRIGTTVVDTLVSFLEQTGTTDYVLFSQLLRTILKGFASGRLLFSLAPNLTRSMMKLCTCLSSRFVEDAFQETAQIHPDISVDLQRIASIILSSIADKTANPKSTPRTLTDAIGEGLINARWKMTN